MTLLLRDCNVSRETEGKLRLLADLIGRWTRKINLIGSSSAGNVWERHILDSLQFWIVAPANASTWGDLGSGAGLPGLVIAVVAAEQSPSMKIHLVESDKRKAVFIRTASHSLSLTNTIVHAERIESLAPLDADIVSARALAPLDRLLPMVERHVKPGGMALLAKGQNASREIADVRSCWRFDLDEVPSRTDPTARLLRLERIERATIS